MQGAGPRILAIWALSATILAASVMAQPPAPPELDEPPLAPPGLEQMPLNLSPPEENPPSQIEALPVPAARPQAIRPDDTTTEPGSTPENVAQPQSEKPPTSEGISFEEGLAGDGLQTYWDESVWDQPACEACPFMWGVKAFWSFEADVVILQRQQARNVLLSHDGAIVNGPDLLTSKSISFNVEPGLRITAKRFLGSDLSHRDYLLELSYFGLLDWSETASAVGSRVDVGGGTEVGSLLSSFDPTIGGFNRADLHRIEYTSHLDNLEMNLRIRNNPVHDRLVYRPRRGWMSEPGDAVHLSMLGGMRFLSVEDNFDFFSMSTITQNGVPTGPISGDYRIETRNRLLGLQIGLAVGSQTPRFSWSVTGRMGPYINFLRQRQNITFNDANDPFAVTTADRSRQENDERVAMVGQVSMVGRFRLLDHFNLRAGYDFMWVQGLALAPEQLDFTDSFAQQTNRNGILLYQGLSLGVEYTW